MPVRIAVFGAGPAGFYACEELLKSHEPVIEVDLFDRLPTPYGLVRYGVAPDHQKIKTVTAAFDKVAGHERLRFIGNVEFGRDISLEEALGHYHGVLLTVGASSDRRMGIPGEDLRGSYPATEFVAWYNGHPDFQTRDFHLDGERVAVVGVGNVAIDVARILSSSQAELAATDITPFALAALKASRVKEVVILGRRGPAQAAFTNPELRELSGLEEADFLVDRAEVELDPHSAAALQATPDKAIAKRLELLQVAAARLPEGKPRQLRLRFLVSPTELLGDEHGRVRAVRVVHNELNEKLQAVATERTEEIPVCALFRSIGYRGLALPNVPFDEKSGVIPNRNGRVLDQQGSVVPGLYVAGWIKRGPSGVIGTNKPCAKESVQLLLEDLRHPERVSGLVPKEAAAVLQSLRARGVRSISFDDWRAIDRHEITRGLSSGSPRVKCTSVEEMVSLLDAVVAK
jgi:ferredoxin--NADP+ reductase